MTDSVSFSNDNFKVYGVVNPGESMICRDGSWMDWADVSSYIAKSVMVFEGRKYSFDNFGIKVYSIPAKKNEVRSANTIKLDGHSITKAKTIKVKKSTINKKAVSYMVTRNGKGKLSMKNKTSKKLKKYLSFKSDIVTLKKKAPKGRYRFTLTVAANGKWKKATTKLITIIVK